MSFSLDRRRFLTHSAHASLLAAGGLLLPTASFGAEERYKIKNIAGFTIDFREEFGPLKELLTKALGRFYARFLQVPNPPEIFTEAGVDLVDGFKKDDYDGASDRDILNHQLTRMRTALNAGEEFPHITIEYGFEKANWAARAQVNLMRVTCDDRFKCKFDGQFKLQVNAYYLNNAALGRHYADPTYWAGVIAHELWHNLGHGHPGSRDDKDYYLYQIILAEMSVMNDGKVKYGDRNAIPVLCMRHPRK